MRRHLREPFGLTALARGVGASTRTLARRVQTSLATTPARWVRRVRAEEARRLLETSRLPIERIAEEVGFGSALSMRRTVVALYGATPRELRRSVLGRAAGLGSRHEGRRASG
jgi:transcriptional regulator GlxA family with amidase domain